MTKKHYFKKIVFGLLLAAAILLFASSIAVYHQTWGTERPVFKTIEYENTYDNKCIVEVDFFGKQVEYFDEWYIHIKNNPPPIILGSALIKVVHAERYDTEYEFSLQQCVIHQDISGKTKFFMPNQYGPCKVECELPYDRKINARADKVFVHEDHRVAEFVIDDTWYCAPLSRLKIQGYTKES